jgi:hypothetical protein
MLSGKNSENLKLETCNLKRLNEIHFTLHRRRKRYLGDDVADKVVQSRISNFDFDELACSG